MEAVRHKDPPKENKRQRERERKRAEIEQKKEKRIRENRINRARLQIQPR